MTYAVGTGVSFGGFVGFSVGCSLVGRSVGGSGGSVGSLVGFSGLSVAVGTGVGGTGVAVGMNVGVRVRVAVNVLDGVGE